MTGYKTKGRRAQGGNRASAEPQNRCSNSKTNQQTNKPKKPQTNQPTKDKKTKVAKQDLDKDTIDIDENKTQEIKIKENTIDREVLLQLKALLRLV